MVPGAAAHEKIRHGAVRGVVTSIPAGGPPDDLEIVVVAMPHDVAAGVGQPPHDVEVSRRG
jgi:hypothetical protein